MPLASWRALYAVPVHQGLERRLAAFKSREAAIVYQTGYDTNVAAFSTLAGAGDVIISDALNHASIVAGIRLSRAERRIYPHNDMSGLEEQLRALAGARTIFIVTDSVFSMGGCSVNLLTESYHPRYVVQDEFWRCNSKQAKTEDAG